MHSSENQKTEKFVNDINYHLHDIKLAINTLQLEHTMDMELYMTCDKIQQRLIIVEKIMQIKRLQLPIAISCKVNDFFIEDKNLSIINLQIINGKRNFNPTAIAHLKITT